ncbi:MAG TPA: hypothetical protein VHE30_23340 [Polyangiaceae bacterium]|nr:hypothetical protein [Polyangiaceae bacterium]
MTRRATGVVLATGLAFALASCDEDISDSAVSANGTSAGGEGGEGGSGNHPDAGRPVIPNACEGQCCPTKAECYAGPDNGKDKGGECLAKRDNTGQDHIQMRQAWIRTTTPKGNTDSLIYGTLAGRSELPYPDCYETGTALGSGGYIQIIDFFLGGSDIEKHYAMLGYSTFVSADKLQTTLATGFCFGEEQYVGDQKYWLPTSGMTPSADYPPGLPKPMGLADGPWHVGPTTAKRLAEDFDPHDDTVRRDLLAKLDDGGEYGSRGYGGVFFYDPVRGYAHGYGRLGWTVVYAKDGKTHMAIPIREIETKSTFNDPAHPNCVGEFRGDVMKPSSSPPCSSNDPKNPKWGGGVCGDHVCNPGATPPEAPASIKGYFLISELEQIYSPDLLKTLCVSYPGPSDTQSGKQEAEVEGFYNADLKGCRSAKWDPTKADGSGIPKGDWCAATNSPAHDNCHDAWNSESIHVFSAGKIQVPADGSRPQTCPFDPVP